MLLYWSLVSKNFKREKNLLIYPKILAGNEHCPQPQTAEHLAAAEIMKLNSIIVLQTKIDLIGLNQAQDNREQIEKFIQSLIIIFLFANQFYINYFRYYSTKCFYYSSQCTIQL